MEGRSFLIVHESGVPCQLGSVHFAPVRARRASRVTGSLSGSFTFTQFVQEEGFPVRSYKSTRFEAGSLGAVGTLAPRLVRPLADVVDNSVDGGVRGGGVPCGGTGFKIVARRAGALGGIGAQRPLSTGRPVQGRRMDQETAPNGGVRFGVYTGPMTTQMATAFTVLTAPVGTVGR